MLDPWFSLLYCLLHRATQGARESPVQVLAVVVLFHAVIAATAWLASRLDRRTLS